MKKISSILTVAMVALATSASAQSGELRVVTEGGFPPWNLTDPSGAVKGFEIDFMNAVCSELKVRCTFATQSFDAMIPAINDGKFDVIVDALGITAARKEVVDFTAPYAGLCYSFASVNSDVKKRLPTEDRIEVLTDANLETNMARFRDAFEGAKIGTLASGTSTRFVAKNLPSVSTNTYKTSAARDLDLKAGRVDILLASKDNLLALKRTESIPELELVGPCLRGDLFGTGGVGIGLKKGNAELKAKLDPVIKKLVDKGTVKKLSEQHFGIDMSPVGLN
ncbi:transporter substrate-binding domain-containing protein (plasmid) [Sinorhizobium meliloti]|uniref:transporter substrate-binding domain-containing protein n=1 Tax=Rhizobium meliloti TaxID=382 RepID=UPI000FD723F8|nr:transporter substrate-binding domain-containing protein [Sinorhizobium meliloti]MDW9359038.1 transporter substrate-binding domain-containing protein [Sinorhizobium meliloti]MDW9418514.1 transporter substrate-binding domain-containing protein [Sinorhizobium meliloti]MDW9464274.1 transporter substrate-binding domain-containing protein [Sinorhizobium meliloti]MDW9514623.1 transporter substrate-binding domain-containing protein [Sinorhizobium meliloti]MDW9626900.1 transporter substrate-binding 